MHYAKAKDGSFPGMKKGDKVPEEPEDLKKTNERKLEMSQKEIVDRNPHLDVGKLGFPKADKKKDKKK